MLTTTPDGLPNDRGRVLGPHEGRGMTVPLRDIRVDVTHERADGLERRTANGLAGEDTEPRLDHVQPGCAFRGEVKLNLRMLGEPGVHGRRRMRRRVVEHDVQTTSAIATRQALHEAIGFAARGKSVGIETDTDARSRGELGRSADLTDEERAEARLH